MKSNKISQKGIGAQTNLPNSYLKEYRAYSLDPATGLEDQNFVRQLFQESPNKVLSKNDSPDLPFKFSINPYQGCEHGCIYCYARNSHEYWGFNMATDFERKLIFKPNVAENLEKELLKKSWKPQPVMISGNTDCYQPLEKTMKLTRSILRVFLKYQNPVGIVTKNSLIERDIDLLQELSKTNLVHVYMSINSLSEDLRRKLEPRTSTYQNRIETIGLLNQSGIPTGALIAPIIPGLNHHEIANVLKSVSQVGARNAGYTVIRLNKQLDKLFEDWLQQYYPDRKQKVINQIKELHDGKLNDSEFGRRMKGSGEISESIKSLFDTSFKKHLKQNTMPEFNSSKFRHGGNYQLF